ncbi:MAG TPA: tetratricopeptide repeat protein [Planctomycetia bacterium]|nr:tetratricopeptide repeat protein [Planctomycetia bacterium]
MLKQAAFVGCLLALGAEPASAQRGRGKSDRDRPASGSGSGVNAPGGGFGYGGFLGPSTGGGSYLGPGTPGSFGRGSGNGSGGNRPPGNGGNRPPHCPPNSGGNCDFVWTPSWGWSVPFYYPYDYGYYDPWVGSNVVNQNDQIAMQNALRAAQAEIDARDKQQQERLQALRAANRKEKLRQVSKSGVKLFLAGNYRLAADRFKQVADQSAGDPLALAYLAQAQFADGRYGDAVRTIESALKANPNLPALALDFKSLYTDGEVLDVQLGRLATEIKSNPLDRDGLFLLGYQLFSSGEKEKARIILEQAGRLDAKEDRVKPFLDAIDAVPWAPPKAGAD